MKNYDHVLVVLDHTSSMLTEGPLNSRVDLDISSRNKSTGSISALPNPNSPYFVARSYWTSAVENALEIRRVMQDIFYTSKNLCIVGFDSIPRVILDWNVGEVQSTTLSQLLEELGSYGPPNKNVSQLDFEEVANCCLDKISQVTSEALVIVISNEHHFKVTNQVQVQRMMKRCLANQRYFCRNPSLRTWGGGVPAGAQFINDVTFELLVLSNEPVSTQPSNGADLVERSGASMTQKSGGQLRLTRSEPCLKLWQTVMKCLCRNLKLACSIITNIPMKEEQQKHTSLNYDVELLHRSDAHQVILSDQTQFKAITSTSSGGLPAVNLKWLSPKLEGGPEAITNCIGTCRISPLDVLARHSTCLTNFLTSGRTVTLEQSQRDPASTSTTGPAVATHIMTCHAGVIYLHILAHPRPNAPLEDGGMPSVTECPGGKLLDYRVPDFVKVIKKSLLAPMKGTTAVPKKKLHTLRRSLLARKTKFFPLTSSQCLLTNLSSYLPLLLEGLTKSVMSESDFGDVLKLINSLSGLEKQNVSLPVSNSAVRPSKRDEQYKMMWSELQDMTALFAQQSPRHHAIYVIVTALRSGQTPPTNLEEITRNFVGSANISDDNDEDSEEIQDVNKKGIKRKQESDDISDKVSRKKPSALYPMIKLTHEMFAGKKSLYDVWDQQMTAAYERKRRVFSKRHDPSYSLYCHVNLKDEPTAT